MPVLIETYAVNTLMPVEFPQDARVNAARFGPSQTLAAGTVLGKKTADNKLYPYASGNVDGTQSAVGLCMYDVTTDANGLAYLGSITSPLPAWHAGPQQMSQFYVAGSFDPAELIGWDATAATTLKATTTYDGYIKIPV